MQIKQNKFVYSNIMYEIGLCAFVYLSWIDIWGIVGLLLRFLIVVSLIVTGFPDNLTSCNVQRKNILVDSTCKLLQLVILFVFIPLFGNVYILYSIILLSLILLINCLNRKSIYDQLVENKVNYNLLFESFFCYDDIQGKLYKKSWYLLIPFLLFASSDQKLLDKVVVWTIIILVETYILKKLYNNFKKYSKITISNYLSICMIYAVSLVPLFIMSSVVTLEIFFVFAYVAFCTAIIRNLIRKHFVALL